MTNERKELTPLMTPEEVAPLIRMKKKTVRDMCNRGSIKARKIGGRWLIAPKDLKRFGIE